MKSDVFKKELERFKNDNVRQSTITILEDLPEYFYKMPASTSGKYHPAFSLGEGGLVRHVKAAMRMLEEIFRNESFGVYDEYTKDLMRMSLLLHDGFKSGITYTGYTCSNHPVLMSKYILENKDRLSISDDDCIFVSSLILTHMGPWNKDKDGNVIMPTPKSQEELIIHLCDYFSSRKFINVTFENNEIVDSDDRSMALSLTNKNS